MGAKELIKQLEHRNKGEKIQLLISLSDRLNDPKAQRLILKEALKEAGIPAGLLSGDDGQNDQFFSSDGKPYLMHY